MFLVPRFFFIFNIILIVWHKFLRTLPVLRCNNTKPYVHDISTKHKLFHKFLLKSNQGGYFSKSFLIWYSRTRLFFHRLVYRGSKADWCISKEKPNMKLYLGMINTKFTLKTSRWNNFEIHSNLDFVWLERLLTNRTI